MFKPSRRIDGAHRDAIWSICWSHNAIFSGSLDGSTKLWKDDLSFVSSTKNEKVGVTSIICLHDHHLAATCSQDSIIRFYSSLDLSEQYIIDPGFLEAWTISASPTEDLVATGGIKGHINIWSRESSTKVKSIDTGGDFILSSVFSPDGNRILSSSVKGEVQLNDIETGSRLLSLDAHSLPVRQVKFSKDGGLIYTVSDDRHACIFDALSGTMINSFSHSGMSLCIDTSPSLRHFVVGSSDHTVTIWDLGMQRQLHVFNDQHSDQVWTVCFDETGKRIVSGGDDALIQMYESS